MGVDKHRRKAAFLDGLTVAGSAGFSGSEVHSGVVTEQGSINFAGGLKTFNAQIRVNTPRLTPATSGSTQYAGFTRLASGTASVVVSTTVVKSNSLIMFGAPIVAAALPVVQASGSIPSGLCVSTITEASFFTIAWLGAAYGAPVDIPWKIDLQV